MIDNLREYILARDAVINGDLETLKHIVEGLGLDVSMSLASGWNPLSSYTDPYDFDARETLLTVAVVHEQKKIIKYLLEREPEIDDGVYLHELVEMGRKYIPMLKYMVDILDKEYLERVNVRDETLMDVISYSYCTDEERDDVRAYVKAKGGKTKEQIQ